MKPLTGVIKNYDWGSPTAIPTILRTAVDGNPQAEYWLGSHPSGPALVEDTTLDQLLRARPELLGPRARGAEAELPFLMKLLAADRPLSLQAHPSTEEARAGFDREQAAGIAIDDPTRTFRDRHAKPEVLVALGDFEALAGFRDPRATAELFRGLGTPTQELRSVIGPLEGRSAPEAVAEVFMASLTASSGASQLVDEVVAAAFQHCSAGGELGSFARTAVLLDGVHPGNPGIIAALLLNRVSLHRGQALYIAPGTMHAYLHGLGVEVMASSDNVLRGGLTSKHIDVPGLVRVVDFIPRPAAVIEAEPLDQVLAHYPEPIAEFDLWRVELSPGLDCTLPGTPAARILFLIEGHARCDSPEQCQEIVQGEAVLLAAGEQVTLRGDCLAFLAIAGQPGR